MNKNNTHELLLQFFGGHFHQDCLLDADSPEAIVAEYIEDTKTYSNEQILILSKAICEYAGRFETDRELENGLYHECGCFYMPSGEGRSAKEWLASLVKQLLDSRGLTLETE